MPRFRYWPALFVGQKYRLLLLHHGDSPERIPAEVVEKHGSCILPVTFTRKGLCPRFSFSFPGGGDAIGYISCIFTENKSYEYFAYTTS